MSEEYMTSSGKYRGSKIRWNGRIGYTFWEMKPDGLEGLCFDFPGESVDDLIKIINNLKDLEAKDFVPDPKYEEFLKEREAKQKKWWYRLWDIVDDIGITVTPFDWKFRHFLVTRPVPDKSSGDYVLQMCRGLFLGPVTITW